ncbi:Conserved_hypothetical protein [Hexamita inflata]|uniref:Uncharacterized protein n=1 Tax=Hexamita inflata TaxID=28002 RepID=A0AA86USJ5_9EUKA|nr:Conserved hypothetical protein [Hexamita inflata]
MNSITINKYEQKMISQYKKDVLKQSLCIQENSFLTSLAFTNDLDINKLSVVNCVHISLVNVPQHLESLKIIGCEVQNINPLKYLSKLEDLGLQANRISDLSSLSQLLSLKTLDLNLNWIFNVCPLQNLVNLSYLNLAENKISDVRPLQHLINLQELNLSYNNISDVDPLRTLVNLKSLNLAFNNIVSVHPLQQMINLERLNLNSNKISDIQSLKHLQLSYLYLSVNCLTEECFSVLNQKSIKTIFKLNQKPATSQIIFVSKRMNCIYDSLAQAERIRTNRFSLLNKKEELQIKTDLSSSWLKQIQITELAVAAMKERECSQ